MRKYLFIITAAGIASAALAADATVQMPDDNALRPDTQFFEDNLNTEALPQPEKTAVAPPVSAAQGEIPTETGVEAETPAESADQAPEERAPQPAASLTENDLRQNPELTAQLVEKAVRSQNWALLADLLPLYRSLPGHDAVLYDYANGALLRSQKKHAEAIAAYRRIIAANPDLSYVRLDLAGMLYENRQYRAAQDQFERAKADNIAESARAMADAYLKRIQKQQGWVIDAGVQYEHNDNVNNASSERYFDLPNGTRFERDEETLPQSANGVRYSLAARRDWNVQGNHYIATEASLDGVLYWDNRDYSEQSVRAGAGYKHQDIRQWASAVPFVGYHRLGGEAYSRNYGISGQYGRWINNNWQAVGSFTHMQKRYARDYHAGRYNGHFNAVSLTGAWLPGAGLMVYGGGDFMRENTIDAGESSKRKGVRAGVQKEWKNGLSTRLNLRHARRGFDEPNRFFQTVRNDKEYYADIAVWHRGVHFYGITPKLNFQYLKVKSDIPLYSRQSRQVFITLEKTF